MAVQHVVPPYFHRVRHTGLHAEATYKKIKDQIPDKLKRNGKTVRTIIQTLTALLKEKLDCCNKCGGMDFEKESIAKDDKYIYQFINLKKRGPPSKKVGQLSFFKHKAQ